jgi:hypothetical protein
VYYDAAQYITETGKTDVLDRARSGNRARDPAAHRVVDVAAQA